MKRIDTFMFNGELDMLECRLVELDDCVDYFVLVEATKTHQGTAKPLHYLENIDRFAPWADRIVQVTADDLTARRDVSNLGLVRKHPGETPVSFEAWSCENAQREYVADGLARLGVTDEDIVLHGDVDEIPSRMTARFVKPKHRPIVLVQKFCPFAVDWQHPDPWAGTVIATVRQINQGFSALRNLRNMREIGMAEPYPPGPPTTDGFHFTWVGGHDNAVVKLDSFCHPEIKSVWGDKLDDCWKSGQHVDGKMLTPIDVDDSWPQWIRERQCPSDWFRPR